MYCGNPITRGYRCKHCKTHCAFCDREIRSDQPDSFGICSDCFKKRIKSLTGSKCHIPQTSFFERRLRRKTELGPDQKKIYNILKNHFNVEPCYRVGDFIIDLYFKDLEIYVIFRSKKIMLDFEIHDSIIRNMEKYSEAFKQSTGNDIIFVFTDELLKESEEDLVRIFSEHAKTNKKVRGEFFI